MEEASFQNQSLENPLEPEPNFANKIVIGPNTKTLIAEIDGKKPGFSKHIEDIAFRFEGQDMGVYNRAIFFFPGIGRRPGDQKRSKDEFRDEWIPKLSLPRSYAQVNYPGHTFIPKLMTRQWEDVAQLYEIEELDLIAVSYGALHTLSLVADIQKRNLPIKVTSVSLIIPGIQKSDLTPLAKIGSRVLGASTKLRKVAPTTSAPHFSALGVRGIAFPKQLKPQDLPPSLNVQAFIAEKDELFDPTRVKASLLELCPKADIITIPGGHMWNRQRIEMVNQATIDFLQQPPSQH